MSIGLRQKLMRISQLVMALCLVCVVAIATNVFQVETVYAGSAGIQGDIEFYQDTNHSNSSSLTSSQKVTLPKKGGPNLPQAGVEEKRYVSILGIGIVLVFCYVYYQYQRMREREG